MTDSRSDQQAYSRGTPSNFASEIDTKEARDAISPNELPELPYQSKSYTTLSSRLLGPAVGKRINLHNLYID
jgi:hypothetical protein